MKFELNYAIVCENALVDAQGRVSFISVFDQINAPSYPAAQIKWFFGLSFNVLESGDENLPLKLGLTIKDEGGLDILGDTAKNAQTKVVPPSTDGIRVVNALIDLGTTIIPHDGLYVAEFFVNDKRMSKIRLRAEVKK